MLEHEEREKKVTLPQQLAVSLLNSPITSELIVDLERSAGALFDTELDRFLGIIANPLYDLILEKRFTNPVAIHKTVQSLGRLAEYWRLYTEKIAAKKGILLELPRMPMLEIEEGNTITVRHLASWKRAHDFPYSYYIALSELSGDGDMWGNLENSQVRVYISGDRRDGAVFETVSFNEIGITSKHANEAQIIRKKLIRQSLTGKGFNSELLINDLSEMTSHLQTMWQLARENIRT